MTLDPERASPSFVLHIAAGPSDIDELGHVSNITYLAWVQDVAKAHSEAVGWDFARYKGLGAVFVVRKHELDYLTSAVDGDALSLETFVASWGGASCVRKTRVVRVADARVLCEAATLWALVSLGLDGAAMGRPRRIPKDLRDDFSRPIAGHAPITAAADPRG